jgi:energy-converting hydrogenase Eha subunit B
MAAALRFNPRSFVLINVGDRVITDTGKTGRVELIGSGGAIAYVQLDENKPRVHFTLFDSITLTVIGDADNVVASQIVGGIAKRPDA